jgi:uncharacterized glyoxalase superfamily protein PhnB
MPQQVVPMIHVPDVKSTADWYVSIGFTLARHNHEDGEMNWASLTLGDREIMLNCGGTPSTATRREFDLYIHKSAIDQLYQSLRDRVEVVETPHDTSYGMREFIIRDLNGFWITFGQPMPSTVPQ